MLKDEFKLSWNELPVFAARFCLSSEYLCSVLTGANSPDELKQALTAVEMGPLSEDELEKCSSFSLVDEKLIDPAKWVKEVK